MKIFNWNRMHDLDFMGSIFPYLRLVDVPESKLVQKRPPKYAPLAIWASWLTVGCRFDWWRLSDLCWLCQCCCGRQLLHTDAGSCKGQELPMLIPTGLSREAKLRGFLKWGAS